MPEVHTTSGSLAYEVSGRDDAPALLLSNSLGTTSALWAAQAPAWSSRFRVIRYDTRGHGESTTSPGEYTLDLLGRDALAILDALEVDRAHLCGISLGGLTAMWLARHAPARVDHVVLANTAARVGTVEMWNARIAQVSREGMAPLAEQAVGRWFTPRFIETHADTVGEIHRTLVACDPSGYAACCAALRDADLSGELPQMVAPALVITGTHDPATPPSAARTLLEGLQNARLLELDAAHLSNVEQPRQFTDAVVAFLSGDHADG